MCYLIKNLVNFAYWSFFDPLALLLDPSWIIYPLSLFALPAILLINLATRYTLPFLSPPPPAPNPYPKGVDPYFTPATKLINTKSFCRHRCMWGQHQPIRGSNLLFSARIGTSCRSRSVHRLVPRFKTANTRWKPSEKPPEHTTTPTESWTAGLFTKVTDFFLFFNLLVPVHLHPHHPPVTPLT